MSESPKPCENNCIMVLADEPCDECMAHYQYWAEVDNSEMDIDWDEWHRFDGMTLKEAARIMEGEGNG